MAMSPIPAPLWIVEVLHAVTFTLHTAAMNVMVALAFALAMARGRFADAMLSRSATSLPVAMSFTITLGVAPLLFLQLMHGERFYASSVLAGWPWLLAVFALMIGYYAAYACEGVVHGGKTPGPVLRAIPLCGLLLFSFVLAANVTLSERPDVIATITAEGHRPGWILALSRTGAPLRWAHEIVGAIAFGSVWFIVVGVSGSIRSKRADHAMAQFGLVTLAVLTVVTGLLGIGKRISREGDFASAGPMLYVSAGLALAVPMLGWLAVRHWRRSLAWLTALTAFLAIAAGTHLRFRTRDLQLQTQGVSSSATGPHDGALLFFLACFLVATFALLWLASMWRRAHAKREVS